MVRCGLYQTAGPRGFRSSRTDRGAQVLPPARATVPPWLPAKSARVSNLPACCALGPPACAAQYSCRRDLAPAVRHGCRSAGLACPLGSSTAAKSRIRLSQRIYAGLDALYGLALTRFIPHCRPPPAVAPPPSPGPAHYLVARDHRLPALRHVHLLMNVLHRDVLVSASVLVELALCYPACELGSVRTYKGNRPLVLRRFSLSSHDHEPDQQHSNDGER